MNNINYIKEEILNRFSKYKFLKMPLFQVGNPNDDYLIEFVENKYIISYFDWRSKKNLFESKNESEIISNLTNILTNDIAIVKAKEYRIKYIDSRIFWFAKHVELLFEFKEFELAKKQMSEYTQILGYNIFDGYEEIIESLNSEK